MRALFILVVSVTLANSPAVSTASIVVYTNKDAWSSAAIAIGGYFTEKFDNFSTAAYGSAQMSSGLTIKTGPDPHGSLTQVQYSGVSRWHDSSSNAAGDTTVFDFHQAVNAVGGDWDLTSSWIGPPNPLRIYLDGHPVSQLVIDTQFFGVVSTEPFSTMTVTYGGTNNWYQNWDIDNLSVSQLPEPGAGLLAALGAVGFAILGIRRLKSGTDNQRQ